MSGARSRASSPTRTGTPTAHRTRRATSHSSRTSHALIAHRAPRGRSRGARVRPRAGESVYPLVGTAPRAPLPVPAPAGLPANSALNRAALSRAETPASVASSPAGCRAGAACRWRSRAAGSSRFADDVHEVLVGHPQAQVRVSARSLARPCSSRCPPQMPRRHVGVGELPLEGGGALEAVLGVHLAADRVEQQRHGVLGSRLLGALAHADDAGLASVRAAQGDLLEARVPEAAARARAAPRRAGPPSAAWSYIEVSPRRRPRSKSGPKTVMIAFVPARRHQHLRGVRVTSRSSPATAFGTPTGSSRLRSARSASRRSRCGAARRRRCSASPRGMRAARRALPGSCR